jgi:hypothetical protein
MAVQVSLEKHLTGIVFAVEYFLACCYGSRLRKTEQEL